MSEDLLDPSLSCRFPERRTKPAREWYDTETVLDKAGLGKFGAFPFETLQQILVVADIRSLLCLESVSKNMRRAVGTIREFHTLLECAQDTIRILTATGVDSAIACRDLYNAFCRPMCDLCEEPGIYLYLLACHRLCATCLSTNHRYRALRPLQASVRFNLPMSTVRTLPMLRVPKLSRIARVSRRAHRVTGYRNTTGWSLIDSKVARRANGRSEIEVSRAASRKCLLALNSTDSLGAKVRITKLYAALPPVEAAFSASVRFPYYDPSTGQIGEPATWEADRQPNHRPS
ncbi:F-box domain-containing protein [Cordyceps javanica]|uniref:F-box domain-containing protein n=1 Tax=Cordyceps javanica TaxID=43265 RepID=A0A545UQ98_9HYPO|nr:F-box domain-containing protein [Cordyceps javanica]TQW03574.1 F-box domain containing protein [Cordyceps javanica]